jgi:hypothetical protein
MDSISNHSAIQNTKEAKCKRLFFIVAMTFSLLTLATFCSAENSDVQQYLNRLTSSKIEVKILAAKEITTSGITDPELFDKIEKQLLLNYTRKDLGINELDLLAWYCKDLASSGLKDYSTTLTLVVANSPSNKLRNHARQSLKSLSMHSETLVKTQNLNVPNLNEQNANLLRMLKSGDIKLKTNAAKMVTRSVSIDKLIYDEIESQLLSEYKSTKNDRHFIDLMSWYCKALSSSGQNRYKPTLRKYSTARTAS